MFGAEVSHIVALVLPKCPLRTSAEVSQTVWGNSAINHDR